MASPNKVTSSPRQCKIPAILLRRSHVKYKGELFCTCPSLLSGLQTVVHAMVVFSIFALVLSIAYGADPSLASKTLKRAYDYDILGWIDPLIGSRNGGNVFSGATLPYGMAKGWYS